MTAERIIFYVISFLIIGGAVLSVTSKLIFRSAVFLLASLLGVAGLYFFLEFEFIAAVQIVVYAGGIVVLIIFSIFLTQGSGAEMKSPANLRKLFSAIIVLLICGLAALLLRSHVFTPEAGTVTDKSTKTIGRQLLSTTGHGYILPFETVSILLLAAMVGCIAIAGRTKK